MAKRQLGAGSEVAILTKAYGKNLREAPWRTVLVRRAAGEASRGWLTVNGRSIPVSLGRGGILANKREGDGGTPLGSFHPIMLWWRADRYPAPRTLLPSHAIGPQDAWSEDPTDRLYNRPVMRKTGEPGDRLMRDDHLYDFIVEIDHNTQPRIAHRGSAVFLHLARDGFTPTAGCVGMSRGDMLYLLSRLAPSTKIIIG